MILHLLKLIRYFLNYNGQLDSYFLKILLLLGSVGLTFIRTEAFLTNLVFGTVLFLRTLHFLEKTCHVLPELFLGRFRVLPNERVLQGSFERNPLVRITIGSQSEEVLELLRQVLFLENCPELVGIWTWKPSEIRIFLASLFERVATNIYDEKSGYSWEDVGFEGIVSQHLFPQVEIKAITYRFIHCVNLRRVVSLTAHF